MINFLLGITAASALAAAQAPAAAPAGRTLADLPNTTVTYFDVSGKTVEEIQESIQEQQKNGVSTSADWEINAGLRKRTEGTTCTVTGAEVKLTGEVKMPKLANESEVSEDVKKQWNGYVADLKEQAAARLWFVHDRLGLVEKAILASSCDGVPAAAGAAIDEIRKQDAAFVEQRKAADK